jgi:hypothetical protein
MLPNDPVPAHFKTKENSEAMLTGLSLFGSMPPRVPMLSKRFTTFSSLKML